ncbi:MAG: hypothetical protein JWQ81_6607 [Amycolatopsis sp.]|uniref:DUF6069 family protein n=1 Tax=Amycolatopsis sp. TaxID=37632 RepID=UPI00260C7BCE|nr:DUF6069 family protein [Amycolatopsis sp.]MCU1685868.1 hypothetical protein [Amycolatopsis sp.]
MTASTTFSPSSRTATAGSARRWIRALTVGAAIVAASAVWFVASALGVDFHLADGQGEVVLTLPIIAGFTLVCSALGWAALALFEHFTPSAAKIWSALATAVLVLSFVPIFLEHATVGTEISLVLVHLAVGVVLIPRLPKTTSRG